MGKRFTLLFLTLAVLVASMPAWAGYRGELRRATKKGQLYNTDYMDADIIWHATYYSDRFREALEKRYVKMYRLTPEEEQRFHDEQEFERSKGIEFFISIYTKKNYRDFSIDPESFWKVYLTTASGREVRPIEIEKIPPGPLENVLYPHLDRWSKAYRVTFPRIDLGDQFWLTAHSIVGDSTVHWKKVKSGYR